MANVSMSIMQDGKSSVSGRPYPHPAQEVITWVVALLNISLNLLVFVVVPRIKTLRVSTTIGMLSLAVTDFSMGITCLIAIIYNTYSGFQLQTDHPLCALVNYGLSLFSTVSIVMLAYLNVDRLLTFLYPLSYQPSRKRVLVINLVIWMGVLVFQLPNITVTMGFGYYEHAFLCLPMWKERVTYKAVWLLLNFIPTILIIVSFCGSFHLIHSHHKRMYVRASSMRVHYGHQVTDNPDSQWKHDRRTFKVLALMTFGFYIAWGPYAITMAFPEIIVGHTLHPVTDFFTPQLAASNSFWNPIIYMLTLRPFTLALSQLCRTRTGGSVERPVYI